MQHFKEPDAARVSNVSWKVFASPGKIDGVGELCG